MIFATVSASASYVGVILGVVIVLWMIAIRSLGKQFNSLVALQEGKKEEANTVPAPSSTPALNPTT